MLVGLYSLLPFIKYNLLTKFLFQIDKQLSKFLSNNQNMHYQSTLKDKCILFPVMITIVCHRMSFLPIHLQNKSVGVILIIFLFFFSRANAVFVSALYLIHQTNQILYTVKSKSE